MKYGVDGLGLDGHGRSPYGERGLKSSKLVKVASIGGVALLTESVD